MAPPACFHASMSSFLVMFFENVSLRGSSIGRYVVYIFGTHCLPIHKDITFSF
uniref:Uncharacterized protein n=1 Tax=Rhizophora mucronata TaxID=61149 RepID=A0A2P2QRT3_RHIMU